MAQRLPFHSAGGTAYNTPCVTVVRSTIQMDEWRRCLVDKTNKTVLCMLLCNYLAAFNCEHEPRDLRFVVPIKCFLH